MMMGTLQQREDGQEDRKKGQKEQDDNQTK
jgi:hypothetical protein